jgi:cation diffusion facilitator family transporter
MRDHEHDHPSDAHDSHQHPAHDHDAAHDQGGVHDHAEAHPHSYDDDHEHEDGQAGQYGPAADGHAHDEQHDHAHAHDDGWFGRLREALPFFHGHSHGESQVDAALEGSERGIWALKVSLLGLGVTALLQLAVVLISGSVGLLADTIHNFGDALTAVPLGIAFVLGRRPPTRRYTYGYARAEDIAGVAIIALIFLSALVAAYESYRKLVHPQPLHHLGWVMAAALVGFIGNEAVAQFRIREGKQIGSAALVADGQHARTDGFTSLAVLVGALGVWAGFPLADPIIGLLITVAILFVVKDTVVVIWRRLMDAIDPELVAGIERVTAAVPGVEQVQRVRVRWLGHRLEAEVPITLNGDLPVRDGARLAEEVRHTLLHAFPSLLMVSVLLGASGDDDEDALRQIAHHR